MNLALRRARGLHSGVVRPSGDLPAGTHYWMVTVRGAETAAPPAASVIADVLRPVALGRAGTPTAQWGGWVGPAPRVTRDRDWGIASAPNVTRVAWLYQFPPGAFYDQHSAYMVQQLANAVTAALESRDPGPSVLGHTLWPTWDPARVDPATVDAAAIDWWQSGRAATEATFIDTVPTLPTTTPDNPTAPGNEAAGAEGIVPSLPTAGGIARAAAAVAIAAVVVVGAVELGPPLARWATR